MHVAVVLDYCYSTKLQSRDQGTLAQDTPHNPQEPPISWSGSQFCKATQQQSWHLNAHNFAAAQQHPGVLHLTPVHAQQRQDATQGGSCPQLLLSPLCTQVFMFSLQCVLQM